MKFSYRTRIVLFVLALIVINVLAFSITLVDKTSYKNSLYYRFSRQRFAWIVSDLPPQYAIKAGWAKVNITPSFKTPIANGQENQKWTAVHDSIYTRAVVLDNGTTLAAIITIDLVMMPPTVVQELQKRLPAIGFAWKNVYLGATHSQHSLGGWANDYMGKKLLGDYNDRLVVQLAEAIVKAVTIAKENRATAQVGYNQLSDNNKDTLSDGRFQFLKIRKITGESALICSSEVPPINSSTATLSSLSRDYAGILTDKLERQAGSFVLFMAGSVPVPTAKIQAGETADEAIKRVDSLVAHVTPLVARQPLHTDSVLVAQTTPLIQNDPQVRISKSWRLKPWLTKSLYGDYPAELKAIRIGKTVFVGNPGAFSTGLVANLLTKPVATRNDLIITSFNGGDIGQIVPDAYYYSAQSPYTIGDMNRFGPHTGAFVDDMIQNLVSSLK